MNKTDRPRSYIRVSAVFAARDQPAPGAVVNPALELEPLLRAMQVGIEASGYDLAEDGCGLEGNCTLVLPGAEVGVIQR